MVTPDAMSEGSPRMMIIFLVLMLELAQTVMIRF